MKTSVIARQLTILKSLSASQSSLEIEVSFFECITPVCMALPRISNELTRDGFRPC